LRTTLRTCSSASEGSTNSQLMLPAIRLPASPTRGGREPGICSPIADICRSSYGRMNFPPRVWHPLTGSARTHSLHVDTEASRFSARSIAPTIGRSSKTRTRDRWSKTQPTTIAFQRRAHHHMSCHSSFVAFVQAVAWPTTVLIGLASLKNTITRLVDRFVRADSATASIGKAQITFGPMSGSSNSPNTPPTNEPPKL